MVAVSRAIPHRAKGRAKGGTRRGAWTAHRRWVDLGNNMPADVKTLLEEALRLPPATRSELATKLIESLDDQVADDAAEQWLAEIERRVKGLDAGTAKTVPWEEVRLQLCARHGSKR